MQPLTFLVVYYSVDNENVACIIKNSDQPYTIYT